MPKFTGVYRAANGSWYCKVTVGHDPLTGKRVQVTVLEVDERRKRIALTMKQSAPSSIPR